MNDNLPIMYLTDDEFDLINNSDREESVNTSISIELLKKILTDDICFSKINSFFQSNKDKFGFIYKCNGKTKKIISLTKIDIVIALNNYLNKLNDIPNSLINRYQELSQIVSLSGLKKDYENYIYNISIDNITYNISAISMIELLEKKDFVQIINSVQKINDIKKEHFLYAIEKFFTDKGVKRNYIIPNIIHDNYDYILREVDLEAINRFTETIDKTYRLIKVDKDLEKEVLDSIPNDLSNLEKSIYLYIKMCKLFSYDEEVYVHNQKGECLKKHQDYHYIENINLNNREVVCFEFNVLYCYFLQKLGINFKSNYLLSKEENYGMGHVSVEYRSDKFLVNADSTINIIYSDLYYAKFNRKLEGIKCLNNNKRTQNEFNKALNRVYERIYGKEENFDNLNIGSNDSITRLNYLFSSYHNLQRNDLNVMDGISYFIDLYRTLFDANERKNNVKVTFVRIGSKINVIVTVNELGVENINDNIYYLVVPNKGIKEINLEELQSMFSDGYYSYVNEKRDTIPGIRLLEDENVKRM